MVSTKYGALLVAGPDASKFLQGQLTCDVNAVQIGQTIFGAYCNIKGRVDTFFRLRLSDKGYILIMPSDQLEFTLSELKKYAVFSKVELNILPEETKIDDYSEIITMIPEVYAQTRGQFFAHDLNLPALGAISFDKGCYRGQEIVARMEYRGVPKRGLYRFKSDLAVDIAKEIVTASGNKVGTVVRTAAEQNSSIVGLAVCDHAVIKENFELYIDGHSIFMDA